MANTKATSDQRWAQIGKLGVIVAILVGLANLYTFLRPKDAALVCRCNGSEVDLPIAFGILRSELSKVRDSTRSYALRDRMLKLGISEKDPGAIEQFAKEIADGVERVASIAVSKLDTKRSVVECEIANIGRREAKDVIFTLPFDVGPATLNGSPVPSSQISGKSFHLGSVKPGVTLNIVAWSDSYASFSRRGESFLLTYEDGRASVELPTVSYGAAAAAATFLEFVTISPVVLVFFLASVVLIFIAVIQIVRQKIAYRERAAVDRYRRAVKGSPETPSAPPTNGAG